LPIWAEFMKRIAGTLPPEEFEMPSGIEPRELCSVSYLRPVSTCPTYTEYFKQGDEIPNDRCPIHQGSLSEQAQRIVGGIFRSLGGRIAGIFKRR
jgi:membrane carboxypeptidase/penicillin-binding protein